MIFLIDEYNEAGNRNILPKALQSLWWTRSTGLVPVQQRLVEKQASLPAAPLPAHINCWHSWSRTH